MTKILLVWEEIPETIKTFIFDADEAMLKKLKLCHRNYINGECSAKAGKALHWLSDRLGSMEPHDDKAPFQISGDFTVILSGFML